MTPAGADRIIVDGQGMVRARFIGRSMSEATHANPRIRPKPRRVFPAASLRAIAVSRGMVLVVEDEPRLRFIIVHQLVEAGFDVIYHESGEEALGIPERHTPDLVLINILLTGMDGVQVCERIRANGKLARTPVIFLTAKQDSASRARCFAAGANDYITKPWETADLVLRIEGAIASACS